MSLLRGIQKQQVFTLCSHVLILVQTLAGANAVLSRRSTNRENVMTQKKTSMPVHVKKNPKTRVQLEATHDARPVL